jgi:hypothetical protein
MHPNDIRMILNDKIQYEKYEDFMVRRVLAVDPDTRWCPAPDCGFAVVADHLCGLVVRVLGYRFGGPGSIPGINRKKKVVGLERGPLSLVSTN